MSLAAPRRVLIIKPSALGDLVTGLPVLRGLRRSFPSAHLAWMVATGLAPLIEHDTDLDEVVLFDRRRLGRAWRSSGAAGDLVRLLRGLWRGGYDWVLDLQGLFRSGFFARATGAEVRAGFADAREGAVVFYTRRVRPEAPHTVDRNIALARALGVDARPTDMTLQVSAAGEAFAEALCRRRGLSRGQFLVCVPPARWQSKAYPIRHWRKVVAALREDVPVVLLGAPGDRALCGRIAEGQSSGVVDLSGRTGVAEMVGVIATSAGVVCNDSAAKFIAPAVGAGAVTLIGPTRLDRTGPPAGPSGQALVADVPCQGCLRRRCRHVTCMELIDPATVVGAARTMLEGRASPCPTVTSPGA